MITLLVDDRAMGHRANFVVVRDGTAKLYGDSWAGMGCIYSLANGPETAATIWSDPAFEQEEFFEWAFAEGGYLIDFDRTTMIAFGYTLPDEEMVDGDGELDPSIPKLNRAFEQGKEEFLQALSKKWSGWTLIYDDRGVDRFCSYLQEHEITDIPLVEPSHPEDVEPPVQIVA